MSRSPLEQVEYLTGKYEETRGLVRDLTTVLEKRNTRITELEAERNGLAAQCRSAQTANRALQIENADLRLDLAAMGEEVASWRTRQKYMDESKAFYPWPTLDTARLATDARPGCVAAIEGGGGKKE